MTWENNFQIFGPNVYKENGEIKKMRYMSLPPGGVHVPLGTNQWLTGGGLYDPLQNSDNPFICRLRYLSDLGSVKNKKIIRYILKDIFLIFFFEKSRFYAEIIR